LEYWSDLILDVGMRIAELKQRILEPEGRNQNIRFDVEG